MRAARRRGWPAGGAGGRRCGTGGRRCGAGGRRGQRLLLERLDELDDAWRVFGHGAADAVVQVAREERADAVDCVQLLEQRAAHRRHQVRARHALLEGADAVAAQREHRRHRAAGHAI